jgi:beta-glucosidase
MALRTAVTAAVAAHLVPTTLAALDSCEDKPTFTKWKCKAGHDVACWSKVASSEWVCFKPEKSKEFADSDAADKVCQKTHMPPGLGPPFYEAACQLPDWLAPAAPLRQELMMPHVTTSQAAVAPPPAPATTEKPAAVSALQSPPDLDLGDLKQPISWDEAYRKAEATLADLSDSDKHNLMRGVGYDMPTWWSVRKWWYVGNTVPLESANVPSLNMQDAGGGFHTTWSDIVGTVTAWPSMLAAAATWDPKAVLDFAVGVGEEFYNKGANVILGPGVDVARVARNGRNFEYISGEDPYLGSVLARSYVQGVQSQGVAAVMKHWVFNVQETNRESESSIVDEKTAWQLYYPPFQAAVDAGVSAAMCSYNKVRGKFSCSNEDTLKKDLKGKMGFRGFVQSDWWAVHDMSAGAGLDQEMPGTGEHVYFDDDALGNQEDGVVDQAATRVLAVMHKLDLVKSSRCAPPDCKDFFLKNVSSEAHTALARKMATESVVMLKNKGNVLPLTSETKTIAVCGQAAVAEPFNPNGDGQGHGDWATGDYYSGGGSGHVVATYVINAFDGINRRAKAEGIEVIQSLSNKADECADAAAKADVVIVVAGTTSGESRDRDSLDLDGDADSLIKAAGKANSNTVVLIQAPGTVVMPWDDSAAAVLMLFLGGQETGSAWGSVLFGDHAPTGRLPLMIPQSEDDTIPPSDAEEIKYDEKLKTSYRNPDITPLYPFGHGLTYTSFEFGEPVSGPCEGTTPVGQPSKLCVQVTVTNAGKTAGRAIPQLYLEFPSEAGYATPILKGFQRTQLLEAGAQAVVTFALSSRDLSHWDEDAEDWVTVSQVTAHIGESSGDIRKKMKLLGLSEATASEPYDCTAGYSNWQAGWSEEKKEWCCLNKNMACQPGRSDPYDCEAGYSNWLAGWSDGKKKWCCENKERGCVESASEPAEGGFCCFGAGGLDGCSTCSQAALAASDSVCGASAGDCAGCGGGSIWCPESTRPVFE